MVQLIDRDDFQQYVKFSANIPARDVDYQCKDAQEFDVMPLLPVAVITGNNMMTDIEVALFESPVTKQELVSLYNDFVKPLLVCKAYARYLLWAGRNVSQFGLRVNNEDTSIEVSDKARGELIADVEHKCNVYLSRLLKELNDKKFTFDTIKYTTGCEVVARPKTKIISI